MREIRVRIPLPEVVYKVCVWIKLGYRRVQYGYAFRKIPLNKGRYALVDQRDYERLSRHKWCLQESSRTFYAVRYAWRGVGSRKYISMHREILKVNKGQFVDHINHNGLDNRRANLRLATSAQNARNRQKCKSKKTSKYKGVCWHKRDKKWMGQIMVNNKSISLGYFEDEKKAARAYDAAARKYHGEFAETNF